MKGIIISLLLVILTSIRVNAQLTHYPFDVNLEDVANGNTAIFYGDPSFLQDGNDGVLQLEGDEYVQLPDAINSAIDPDISFGYNVRFKITDDYLINPYEEAFGEGKRIIISNKEHDPRVQGFELYFGRWFNAPGYYLVATYGDGTNSDFGLGSKIDLLLLGDAKVGEWIEIRVNFRLNDATPHLTYLFNNTAITSYFNPGFKVELLKASLPAQTLFLGTDIHNNIYDFQGPLAEINLDDVKLYNPLPPGDPEIISHVLDSLNADMEGTLVLSAGEKQGLLVDFISNWDAGTYDANQEAVLQYLSTHDATRGTVFSAVDNAYIDPGTLSAESNIAFVIQQWMIDNLYGPENLESMQGVSFLDHTVFPGAVSSNAPRLQNVEISIDGNYTSDPGFLLNGESSVIRPTGYYAPPGEMITVNVGPEAVGAGIIMRLGAHEVNVGDNWTEFNRFPRISTEIEITSTTTRLVNPFGGGLYFVLPDGLALGDLNVEVNGAVKSPYLCIKPGFQNSLEEFLIDVGNAHTEWVEMESSNFMMTVPQVEDFDFSRSVELLENWDQAMDAYNILMGRPLERNRSEYVLMDRQNFSPFTVAPANNPMYFYHVPNSWAPPLRMIDTEDFIDDNAALDIFHELGHLHNMPTLQYEAEANVHIPKIAAWNIFFDKTLDEAFKYGSSQPLTRDQAALDWFLTHPFRMALRTGWDPFNIPGNLLQYQARGFARNIDIVELYGWESLGAINGYYYELGLSDQNYDPYDIDDDDFIRVASQEMEVNMAPLFEVWGIIPSDQLVEELCVLPEDTLIENRIRHYRDLIPGDAIEIQGFYEGMLSAMGPDWEGTWEESRYQNILAEYNEIIADSIANRFDSILSKYFNNPDCSTTSIIDEDHSAKVEVNIFPNPVDDFTYLQFLDHEIMKEPKMAIYDVFGRVISIKSLDRSQEIVRLDLPAEDFPNGCYFIRVSDGNLEITSHKVVIQRQ